VVIVALFLPVEVNKAQGVFERSADSIVDIEQVVSRTA
jgi:hypothetical protein